LLIFVVVVFPLFFVFIITQEDAVQN